MHSCHATAWEISPLAEAEAASLGDGPKMSGRRS